MLNWSCGPFSNSVAREWVTTRGPFLMSFRAIPGGNSKTFLLRFALATRNGSDGEGCLHSTMRHCAKRSAVTCPLAMLLHFSMLPNWQSRRCKPSLGGKSELSQNSLTYRLDTYCLADQAESVNWLVVVNMSRQLV